MPFRNGRSSRRTAVLSAARTRRAQAGRRARTAPAGAPSHLPGRQRHVAAKDSRRTPDRRGHGAPRPAGRLPRVAREGRVAGGVSGARHARVLFRGSPCGPGPDVLRYGYRGRAGES